MSVVASTSSIPTSGRSYFYQLNLLTGQNVRNSISKRRKQLRLEPWIPAQPDVVSGTWMRERYGLGPICSPGSDDFGHGRILLSEVIRQCIPSQNDGELKVLKLIEQLCAPCRCTFRPGWEISRLPGTGETESHGKYRDLFRVIEHSACHTEPLAQAVAAGVVERYPRLMNFLTRGLARYQDSGCRVQLEDRPGTEWKDRATDGACSDFFQ